jgi:hypothetical protein
VRGGLEEAFQDVGFSFDAPLDDGAEFRVFFEALEPEFGWN